MRQFNRNSGASNLFQSLPSVARGRVLRLISMVCVFWVGSGNALYSNEARQIATVVQRGSFAYAYDPKGLQLFTLSAGDGIAGFTQSTVSIKRGSFIHTYNEKGSQISVIPEGQN